MLGGEWVGAMDELLEFSHISTLTACSKAADCSTRFFPLLNVSTSAARRRNFYQPESLRDLAYRMYAEDVSYGGYQF